MIEMRKKNLQNMRILLIMHVQANRIPFPLFRQRYELLTSKSLDSLNTSGLTKLFFRAGTLGILEQVREDKIGEIIREFQAVCQAFMASKAATIIQKNARY